jgi:DnaK suppressor protein
MDQAHARELLARERARIEQAMGELGRDAPQESDDRVEPGDEGTEDLYRDEYDAGRVQELRDQLTALERAEARLADGTYGLSVESGEPIPDERLEVVPTAERTIEEQGRWERGGY